MWLKELKRQTVENNVQIEMEMWYFCQVWFQLTGEGGVGGSSVAAELQAPYYAVFAKPRQL